GQPANPGGPNMAGAFDWVPGRRTAVPGVAVEDPMSDADNFSLMDLFREEGRSHAATLNQGLLELEKDVANPQKIEPLMRAAHSIKGAARIVNLDSAVQLAHVMEDAFVAAQQGRIRITSADIDLLLRGTDLLARLGQVEERDAAGW